MVEKLITKRRTHSPEVAPEFGADLAEHHLVRHLVLEVQEGAHGLAELELFVALAADAHCVVEQLLLERGLLVDALHHTVVHLKDG